MLEGAPADYDEWGEGWSYAELAPYLERARRQLATRDLGVDELSPWHRAFLIAAGDEAVVHPVNEQNGVRWNAAFAYLDEARARPNLTVLADTLVDRVLLEGDRAVGAATSSGELHGGLTVVTAGAYGTPGILLRSGLGPDRGLPVGEGLCDHVGVGMGWELTRDGREALASFAAGHRVYLAQVTIQARSSHCPEGVCDLFFFPALDADDDGFDFSGGVFAMKPFSRGTVRLNSPDPAVPLAIEHGFLGDQRDLETLVEGVVLLRELAGTEPIAAIVSTEVRPGADADIEAYVRSEVRGFFHPVGTCAMGAVVDPSGRVFGLENLAVADASIMPTIPRANTNLSVAAVAERLAELL